jgi:hypothetical protein
LTSFDRTTTADTRRPMLAINRKLGYQPDPGWYLLLKDPA